MSNRAETPAAEGTTPDLSDGRYLYCVVGLGCADEAPTLETDGVDDEPVSVLAAAGERADGDPAGPEQIAAVVHDCAELYDAADPRLVKRWLVQHQRVVDAATERFGTPIPFQFDTILRGGDEGVREWLRSERETLRDALEALAGTHEYRIDVVRTDPIPESAIVDGDDDLQALQTKIDDASEGRAHLLEKQFEQRLAKRRRERGRALAADVEAGIDEFVEAVQPLEPSPSISLEGLEGASSGPDEAGDDTGDSGPDTGEPVCRFAVLATDEGVDDLGSYLDTVADRDGITVRFTGPWPPYSFVPSLGSEEGVT
ncbi:gas vesicle protein GvpL [Halovivax limisalsi]|uniref:gas vesicle protein GvpL n=1 Tax=Halovivax limisalsi TaxID=1453760 RepID=UPI001FFC45CE|nr:GvpL/GvpF family gas vesicle protein [Halovivax limisalsi]